MFVPISGPPWIRASEVGFASVISAETLLGLGSKSFLSLSFMTLDSGGVIPTSTLLTAEFPTWRGLSSLAACMLERYQTEVEMSPVAEGTQEVGDLNLLDIRKSSD